MIHHSRNSSMSADDSVPDGYLPMAPGHDPLPALVSVSSSSICSGTPSTDPRFSRATGAPVQHSRTSSLGAEEPQTDGYLPMAPGHEPLPALLSASSGSVCSGTPSTDPRFSEYQLEPATSHIVEGERPPRAWSVGSRAALTSGGLGAGVGGGVGGAGAGGRHRAYSVGARCRPAHHPPHPRAPASAPLLPRTSAEDLMELDFSANSPQAKVIVSRTPPSAGFVESRTPRANVDEYVDMSPRNAGFLAPRRDPAPVVPSPAPLAAYTPAAPDGYVEMNYTRAPTRPIAIAGRAPASAAGAAPEPAPLPSASPPRGRSARTPLGSQTIFPISLDSPASPPDLDAHDDFEDDAKEEPAHPLTTVREISEEGRRSPVPSCGCAGGASGASGASPQYVRLALAANPAAHKTLPPPRCRTEASSTATVVVAGACGNVPARFSLGAAGPAAGPAAGTPPATWPVAGTPPATWPVAGTPPATWPVAGTPPATPPPTPTAPEPLNYAALDLQPRRVPQPPPKRTYTQIDFVRSEKLHAADGT